jgi:High potential iron-sulfur protein
MGRANSSPTAAAMQGRRATLRRLTACLLAGAASWISVGHGKDKKDFVCANPSALSQAENQQRKLDNYTEKSLDPGKTCSRCRFFTAGAEPTACGKCEIFNGPANPKGKCDDWAARPV